MRKQLMMLLGILLLSIFSFAQTRQISGKITDEKGNPIYGVSVIVKDTKIGTVTKEDGSFSFNAPATAKTIIISGVGFAEKKVQAGTGPINIVLESADLKLEEIVVTANSIKRDKKSLGYSAPVIKSDELTQGQNASALGALQGKVAGLNISGTAGAPGSSTRVVLRGGSSILGNNQALIVVDGVPIDNTNQLGGQGPGGTSTLSSIDFGNRGNDINPDDIESVTVLKGPGAAALYGSRASNGALIITTKSGKKNQNRKNEITVSSGLTFSNVLKLPDFQNEFGQGGDGEFDPKENWNYGPKFDGVVRPWGQEINGKKLERPYSAVKNNIKDFYETGKAYNNNISIAGNSEKSTYYLSLNALNSNGILPGNYDNFNKYSVRFNGTTKLSNKVTSGISINYTKVSADEAQGGQASGSVYSALLQTPRNIPLTDLSDLSNPYYSFGTSNEAQYGYYGAYTINPYYILKNWKNHNDVDRITGNFNISYKPVEWLDITDRLGTDVYADRRRLSVPKYSLTPMDNTSGDYSATQNKQTGLGSYGEYNYNLSEVVNDLMITARKDIGRDFSGSLMVGHNVRQRTYTQLEVQTNSSSGIVIPGYYNLANSNGPLESYDNFSKRRLVGVYADLNVDYKKMLFLGATARNDWSSTLSKANNSFFYPGVNASFVFSEVLKNTKVSNWLNYGKLRASWAQVGNDADPYLLTDYYIKTTISNAFGSTTFPFGSVPGFTVGDRLGNPNLKPEITTAFEVGTELGFLKNRISVDFSYYQNESRNQILTAATAPASGYTSAVVNAGVIQNKGIELSVRATPVKTTYGLTWEVYGTYTRNKSEVVDINAQTTLGGYSGMSIVAAKGQPYGTFYGQTILTDSLGRVIINTANGMPKTTSTPVFLGSYNPKYMASLGSNITYKNFSFGFLFDTKQGGKFYSDTKRLMAFVGTSQETVSYNRDGDIFRNSVYLDNGKYVENTQYKFSPQTYYASNVGSGSAFAGTNIIDASYIKLREVNFSYRLSKDLLHKTPFGEATVSVFGNNLWIKTASENKYVDPEVNSAGASNAQGFDYRAQPSVRNYGVNLKFTF